jgi:transcription initiation factor IIE alpha subunit
MPTEPERTPDVPEADVTARKALSNVSGYCVRCRTKRLIDDAYEETTESGRRAARGKCPVCGTNMFTFLKEDDGVS